MFNDIYGKSWGMLHEIGRPPDYHTSSNRQVHSYLESSSNLRAAPVRIECRRRTFCSTPTAQPLQNSRAAQLPSFKLISWIFLQTSSFEANLPSEKMPWHIISKKHMYRGSPQVNQATQSLKAMVKAPFLQHYHHRILI